jgi:EmrB/QacA subfamily drug resistance transporter
LSSSSRADTVSAQVPAADAPVANRPWIFAAALSATFMSAVEGTIVATAMPSIVGVLGDFELFSWVFTSYLLAQAATIPVYGKLADLYGRKRVLFFGIGTFLVGSLLCGFAWSMMSLVAFRVLQGIGAGAVMPVSQTIVGDLYRGEERARMQGYISATFGSAAILGPIAGAFLVAHAGWESVFWVNIPLGIASVIALALIFRETVHQKKIRIDYLGSLLMTTGTASLMLALVQSASFSSTVVVALVALAIVCFVLLVVHEQHTPEPILPPRLWRNRFVAIGNANSGICGAISMGVIGFLPAYVQGVMGQSTFIAGLTLTAMSLFWSIGGFVSGRMMLRMPFRGTAVFGSVVAVAGTVIMIFLAPDRGAALAIGGPLIAGFGMGLANNAMVVAIQVNAAWSERGVATSSLVYTRIVGQAMGTAAYGGILNAALASHFGGGGDLVTRMLDPALRASLPAASLAPIMSAFHEALHNIFLINVGLALLILALIFSLPKGQGLKKN